MTYLEGRLRRSREEPEDEYAGYVIEVEVEMSAVEEAAELQDEQIALTGDVEIVDYPERGKVLVFRATSAASMEEDEEEEYEE